MSDIVKRTPSERIIIPVLSNGSSARGRNFAVRRGKPYTAWESEGVAVPLAEAHVEYLGRACYDDLLKVTAVGRMEGKVRLRFDLSVENAETGAPVCRGYTLHAITNMSGRPIRPAPNGFADLMAGEEVMAADGEDDQ